MPGEGVLNPDNSLFFSIDTVEYVVSKEKMIQFFSGSPPSRRVSL